MAFLNLREIIPEQISETLRSGEFRAKAKGVGLDDLQALVEDELRSRGINVEVHSVGLAGEGQSGSHRLVWQMMAGGEFIEQYFSPDK